MLKSVGAAVLFAALLICGFLAWRQYPVPPQKRGVSIPSRVTTLVESGDLGNAVVSYQEIGAAPNTTPNDLAQATRNIAGIRFRMSGELSDVIKDVQDLKRGIGHPEVEPEVQARNIAAIGHMYMDSGEDGVVFEEIFKDEPFRSHLAEGDVLDSIRNLYIWSYEMYPNARSAIDVASFSMLKVLNHRDLSPSERADDLTTARNYLVHAEMLSATEMKKTNSYARSHRYAGYLFWRAFVIGALTLVEGDPDTEQYKTTYEEVLARFTQHGNGNSLQYLPLLHWHYAVFLYAIDNDEAAAGSHLTSAAKEAQTTLNRDFLSLIKNKKAQQPQPNDFLGASFFEMAKFSPEFKALVDSI